MLFGSVARIRVWGKRVFRTHFCDTVHGDPVRVSSIPCSGLHFFMSAKALFLGTPGLPVQVVLGIPGSCFVTKTCPLRSPHATLVGAVHLVLMKDARQPSKRGPEPLRPGNLEEKSIVGGGKVTAAATVIFHVPVTPFFYEYTFGGRSRPLATGEYSLASRIWQPEHLYFDPPRAPGVLPGASRSLLTGGTSFFTEYISFASRRLESLVVFFILANAPGRC